MMDDSRYDPGVANARDSSDARYAHGDRPSRGAQIPLSRAGRDQAPTHFGLGCGIARFGLSYGGIPPLDPSKKSL